MTQSTIGPLANEYITVYESPEPEHTFAYAPGLARLADGRLVATCEVTGSGKVFTSDDGGQTWTHRHDFPFIQARPFAAGELLYVIGQYGDLYIIRSDDGGDTWSSPAKLTEGLKWHQAPCNVHYANDCIYLVMERRVTQNVKGWFVGELAPVLMRGRRSGDLRRPENWTFAGELSFRDAMPGWETEPQIDYFGVPFFRGPFPQGEMHAGRHMNPIGWLETNVVRFTDPNHIWCDPTGRTFHLWMRAHTGGTGYACIAKVVEQGDQPGTGEMVTQLEQAPSGNTMLYVPCPGGQMKFHVLYDEATKLYWLLSTQATDSMIRPDRMHEDRYNLPNNERRRLQLHFSKNMIDWCFAGLIAVGPVEKASRHYASMVIDGEDLCILSRSGNGRAKTAHHGNLITFHRVKNFRALVY